MQRFFISIGSNIRPEENIPQGLKQLQKCFSIEKTSSIYETTPVGTDSESNFWNLAVSILTSLPKAKIEEQLREIEKKIGRKRDPHDKFAPRTIDLDLLPQPNYQKLGFIIIPLAEIEPEYQDPETGKTFSELAACIALKETIVRKMAGNFK